MATFNQTIGKGHVIHEAPVTAIAANQFLLVSGDKNGYVKMSIPCQTKELLGLRGGDDKRSSLHFQSLFC